MCVLRIYIKVVLFTQYILTVRLACTRTHQNIHYKVNETAKEGSTVREQQFVQIRQRNRSTIICECSFEKMVEY